MDGWMNGWIQLEFSLNNLMIFVYSDMAFFKIYTGHRHPRCHIQSKLNFKQNSQSVIGGAESL